MTTPHVQTALEQLSACAGDGWCLVDVLISTRDGFVRTHGLRLGDDSCLAVTPCTAFGTLNRFVITHTPSGRTLWPNHWPLSEAKAICDDLLSLGDWAYPDELREAAESVVRGRDRSLLAGPSRGAAQ